MTVRPSRGDSRRLRSPDCTKPARIRVVLKGWMARAVAMPSAGPGQPEVAGPEPPYSEQLTEIERLASNWLLSPTTTPAIRSGAVAAAMMKPRRYLVTPTGPCQTDAHAFRGTSTTAHLDDRRHGSWPRTESKPTRRTPGPSTTPSGAVRMLVPPSRASSTSRSCGETVRSPLGRSHRALGELGLPTAPHGRAEARACTGRVRAGAGATAADGDADPAPPLHP
jgi:hypothetical protein